MLVTVASTGSFTTSSGLSVDSGNTLLLMLAGFHLAILLFKIGMLCMPTNLSCFLPNFLSLNEILAWTIINITYNRPHATGSEIEATPLFARSAYTAWYIVKQSIATFFLDNNY